MSCWTYVTGCIEVSLIGSTNPQIRYILDTVLEHLPVVTGSERDMDVHVIQRTGYSCISSCDEFGCKTNNLRDRFGGRSRKNGMMPVQDRYILVLDGALRDRTLSHTLKEFTKWLSRLAKRVFVNSITVMVTDGFHKRVFTNATWLMSAYESPSWSGENPGNTPAWYEYMLWESDPCSDYPLHLAAKYFDDDGRIAAELKRREDWAMQYAEGMNG